MSQSGAASVQVLGEQGHPGESLGAVGARVLLDVGMGLKVGPEVGAVGEGSVTQGAGERLLARVRADVAL